MSFRSCLNLCGHHVSLPGLESALFIVGLETSCAARTTFERTIAPDKLAPLPVPNLALGGDFSDYHAFNERGLPYVFFSCGEWRHYHMPSDIVDNLSHKMTRIAQYLESFVRTLAEELPGADEQPGGANVSVVPTPDLSAAAVLATTTTHASRPSNVQHGDLAPQNLYIGASDVSYAAPHDELCSVAQ